MESRNDSELNVVNSLSPEDILTLDNLPLTLWSKAGVPPSLLETVSQHAFKASLLSLAIAEKLSPTMRLDFKKIFYLSLLHELFEKNGEEYCLVAGTRSSSSIQEIVEEYRKQSTIEARIVKIACSLAVFIQGLAYLRRGFSACEKIAYEKLKESLQLVRLEEEDVQYSLLLFIENLRNLFEESRKWVL
ncbi:MAG: hypothetical protein DRJ51_00540 [Thermoprotei archaeon]|nr:MAG: hypothetical protein DRJ51_00540 [Thermoprotei archaeon]